MTSRDKFCGNIIVWDYVDKVRAACSMGAMGGCPYPGDGVYYPGDDSGKA